MSSGRCGTLKVVVTHLYAVVVRGWSRGTECTAGFARAEVIVYFFFIHLFSVSHAYGHSLSMLSIRLGCMAGVPLVGRS